MGRCRDDILISVITRYNERGIGIPVLQTCLENWNVIDLKFNRIVLLGYTEIIFLKKKKQKKNNMVVDNGDILCVVALGSFSIEYY